MKKYSCTVLLCIIASLPINLFASQELHVGDKMPEMLLNNLLNSASRTCKLSELVNGKALILDFFTTWCGPCVKALPVLDQFQRKYKDRIQVLAISDEKEALIETFLNKNSVVRGTSLPFLSDDKSFRILFPHRIIPHEIWIDRNGIIKAITSEEEITDENISEFLNGTLKTLPLKKDQVDFDEEMPLFKMGNGGDGNEFLSRSIFTKNITGTSSYSFIFHDSLRKVVRLTFHNEYPVSMFYSAYSRLQFGALNFNRVYILSKDSSEILKIRSHHTVAEYEKNTYCYEYMPANPESEDDTYRNAFEDLNRYFDIRGTIEKRMVPSWVLTVKDKDLLPKANGKDEIYGQEGRYHNVPLKYFVAVLNRYHQMEPVIDETGYDQPVYMDIDISPEINKYPDIESIRKSLHKYGLELVKEYRSVDVLVIYDKK